MDLQTFDAFLASNIDIDPAIVARLTQTCRRMELKKGEFALRAGEMCKHSFFVEHGLLKQYTIDEKGKEHILLFAPEYWFAANIETVHFGRPSDYFMEALEPTSILLLDQPLIDRLSEEFPAFRNFNSNLLHSQIQELQGRVMQLLSSSAEERYLDFTRRFPSLMLRVSQVQIAAYLGMTSEALSRVRRDLAKKWKK